MRSSLPSRPVKLGPDPCRNSKAERRLSVSRVTKRRNRPIPAEPVTLRSTTASVSHDCPNLDVHREFDLLDITFKPTSDLGRWKQADLRAQMKDLARESADKLRQLQQLQADEKKYNSSSSKSNIDEVDSTDPSSEVSEDRSVLSDSEESVDDVSTMPTSQQTKCSTVSGRQEGNRTSSHESCVDCGFKPLYSCTYQQCNYGTHSLSDWKRHEVGQSHWPQYAYMCLDCLNSAGESHDQICRYCGLPFDSENSPRTDHYLLCETAREYARPFSRKDHFIDHCRISHGRPNMTSVDMKGEPALWIYPINSNWPRYCGFCDVTFTEWNERVKHVAEHFRKGSKIEQWRAPAPPPDDDTHNAVPAPKKDDGDDHDDDDDDTPSGSKGRFLASNPVHAKHQQSSSKQPSSSNNSSRTSQTEGTQVYGQYQHHHERSILPTDNQDLSGICDSSKQFFKIVSAVRIAIWLADCDGPFRIRTTTVASSRRDTDLQLRDFDRLFAPATCCERSDEIAASVEFSPQEALKPNPPTSSAQLESNVVELPKSTQVPMSMAIRDRLASKPDDVNGPSSRADKLGWNVPLRSQTTTTSPPASAGMSCWQPRTKLMAPYHSFTRLLDRAIQETTRAGAGFSCVGARNGIWLSRVQILV